MIIPDNWNKQANDAWVKGDVGTAIGTLLTALNQHKGKKPKGLILQFTYYLFHIKDFKAAVEMLKSTLNDYPKDSEILKNLSVCLSYMKKHEEAIFYANQLVEVEPDNPTVYDTLAESYFYVKQFDKASHAGTQALRLKDKIYGQLNKTFSLPEQSPYEFTKGKKKVISYSLWGSNPRYLRGALRNLLLAPELYPDWELWFWLDESVPADFQALITQLGGIIKKQDGEQSVFHKLSWRFFVSDSAEVGYFLVRDADSSLTVREVRAVDEWLKSGRYFHIMRDWWTHTDLILAGMWGGVAGILPNMEQALYNYNPNHVITKNADQWLLRDEVWKFAKQDLCLHDRCFSHMSPLPWPSAPCHNEHVGCNEFALFAERQQKFLAPWIKNYPCLQQG